MGTVSRNCTEDGWSETFPHYTDVCFFDDNTTGKHVRPRIAASALSGGCCSGDAGLTVCVPPSGHVLRLRQGPVHGRLQHVAGVSDHRHGHPVQIQVIIRTLFIPPDHVITTV